MFKCVVYIVNPISVSYTIENNRWSHSREKVFDSYESEKFLRFLFYRSFSRKLANITGYPLPCPQIVKTQKHVQNTTNSHSFSLSGQSASLLVLISCFSLRLIFILFVLVRSWFNPVYISCPHIPPPHLLATLRVILEPLFDRHLVCTTWMLI